jgi:hypothetical protein
MEPHDRGGAHGGCSQPEGCGRTGCARRLRVRHWQHRLWSRPPPPPLLAAAVLLLSLAACPQPTAAAAGCDGLSVALYKWSSAATAQALATQNRSSVTPVTYTTLSLTPGIKDPNAPGYSWANNYNSSFSMVMSGYIQVRHPGKLRHVSCSSASAT